MLHTFLRWPNIAFLLVVIFRSSFFFFLFGWTNISAKNKPLQTLNHIHYMPSVTKNEILSDTHKHRNAHSCSYSLETEKLWRITNFLHILQTEKMNKNEKYIKAKKKHKKQKTEKHSLQMHKFRQMFTFCMIQFYAN